MITEEIVHVNGMPKKLVVFLHGYQDCAEHIERKTIELQKMDNIALHIPQAPFANEVDLSKRQWYSIHQFDPEDRRRNAVSWDEFVDFYNRMTVGLVSANYYILQYIDGLLSEYNLSYEDLFLCGFSQGAMITIATSLTRNSEIGGAISIAGIVPGYELLPAEIISKPSFLLLHGKEDVTVQYKTTPKTLKWFEEQNIKIKWYDFAELAHRMNDSEMQKVADFINS